MKMADIEAGGRYKVKGRSSCVVVIQKDWKGPTGRAGKAGVQACYEDRPDYKFYLATNLIQEPWEEYAKRKAAQDLLWENKRAKREEMRSLVPNLRAVLRAIVGHDGYQVYEDYRVALYFHEPEILKEITAALWRGRRKP